MKTSFDSKARRSTDAHRISKVHDRPNCLLENDDNRFFQWLNFNDVAIFDRRRGDDLYGISYGPYAICIIFWCRTSAIVVILVIFQHILFHFAHNAKELRRFAGNMMAVRAVLAACCIVLKSMDPNKLRHYLQ